MRRVLCFLIIAILVMGAKKSSSTTSAKAQNPYDSGYGAATMNTDTTSKENTYTNTKASKKSKSKASTAATTTATPTMNAGAVSNLTKDPALLKTLATLRNLQEKDPKALEALRSAGAALTAKNAAAKGK